MMCKSNIMKAIGIILIIVYVSEASRKTSDHHPEENLQDFFIDENVFNRENFVRNARESSFGAEFDISQLQPIMKRIIQDKTETFRNLGIKVDTSVVKEVERSYCEKEISCNIIKIQKQIGVHHLMQISLEECTCG